MNRIWSLPRQIVKKEGASNGALFFVGPVILVTDGPQFGILEIAGGAKGFIGA